MKALEDEGPYDLLNPRTGKVTGTLKAGDVFGEIVDRAWQNGEPGIVFIDRLNRDNPTPDLGEIESTNPCGEQPLLPFESCNLGSINLARMVEGGAVNWTKLGETVRTSTRFLDNVIDMNRYPLKDISHMTKGNRKIGLGIMGWADMLLQLDIPYASEKALSLASEVMQFVDNESKKASQELAAARGPFPNFHKSTFAREDESPVRNATTTTIAPTGTISIISGCSSGIEPLFAISYVRNVLDGTELLEVHPFFEKKAREMKFYTPELMKRIAEKGSIQEMDEVPEDVKRIFQTAHDISPEWHIRMQAAFQVHTDNAVSKTVNFRHDATRSDVEKVYRMAHALGCKGVTVYRDGSRDRQVLSTRTEKKKEEAAPAPRMPKPRPDVTHGSTRKMRTGCGNLYVTINEDEDNRPFEIFSIMGKAGGCAASQTEAICRLISFLLRSGCDLYPIVDQLKGISCHSTIFGQGGKILSCSDAIAKTMELYLGTRDGKTTTAEIYKSMITPVMRKGACPDCGGIVEHEGGCVVCRVCGFSECA
jgi:ribonucleoside-diphosphate reductase alpha chain